MPRRNRSRPDHQRTAVAQEAARIMQEHGMKDFRSAKEKAGLRLGLKDQGALPSNREIASALAERNRIFHGESHEELIGVMRSVAVEAMRRLQQFAPRLVGTVLSGHASEHDAIELHLFSDSAEDVGAALEALGIAGRAFDQRLRMRRDELEAFPAYRFRFGEFEVTATVFPERGRGNAPLSPVDRRPMRRATIRDVESLLS
jgi:hypothetical protein